MFPLKIKRRDDACNLLEVFSAQRFSKCHPKFMKWSSTCDWLHSPKAQLDDCRPQEAKTLLRADDNAITDGSQVPTCKRRSPCGHSCETPWGFANLPNAHCSWNQPSLSSTCMPLSPQPFIQLSSWYLFHYRIANWKGNKTNRKSSSPAIHYGFLFWLIDSSLIYYIQATVSFPSFFLVPPCAPNYSLPTLSGLGC